MRLQESPDLDLFWGDFHKHMTGPETNRSGLDTVLNSAREHLDISVVQCYPFKWYQKGRVAGIREESVGHDPEFDEWWTDIEAASRRYNEPGEFITFPAFEWHGNRTRWGDHNVYYREEGYEIDRAWELPDLLENMTDRNALVLPHHTAYELGNRGKDWDEYDPELSPVSEIYSSHGSNESIDSPVPMEGNHDMGPRTNTGTYQAALNRGHRIGVIASNDGPGLPGTWNSGIAGVWAPELTREAIWEAVRERRTYGVTGDRMRLWWSLDGHPLGSSVSSVSDRRATVQVDCPRPLDAIEVVHNGDVAASYTHQDTEFDAEAGRYRILVEVGWGPSREYGDFDSVERDWSGAIRARSGEITWAQPRFRGFGQSYEVADGECRFDVTTSRAEQDAILPELDADRTTQGFVVEVDAADDSRVVIDLDDGETLTVPLADAKHEDHLFSFTEESADRLDQDFDLSEPDIENTDIIYHNAHKVRVSRADPVEACGATVTFEDLPQSEGLDYYYVRAGQRDGQYAWASPVWVDD